VQVKNQITGNRYDHVPNCMNLVNKSDVATASLSC